MAAGVGSASAGLGVFSAKKAAAAMSEEQKQLQLEYEALVSSRKPFSATPLLHMHCFTCFPQKQEFAWLLETEYQLKLKLMDKCMEVYTQRISHS